MLFSTNIFLFAFLPVCLAIYYGLLRKRWARNRLLLLASIFFYAWGSVPHVFLMLGSIIINWAFALIIDNGGNERKRRTILTMAILTNVTVLFVFKYLSFTIVNLNAFFYCDWSVPQIALPIGISFFTFQAMSYVIDVYRGHDKALTSIYDVGLYISLFPQLVAGPIVRFEDFREQIQHRKESFDSICDGIYRFGYGLGKKVLIADNLAIVAEMAFQQHEPAILMAWLGAITFTLQIYFDFSGYSDMAIGLGKMFGFQFKENFNYPYISTSVSEFWRRWHISMGSWFRDYIYFPLGGSKVAKGRMFFNLFVVWAVTGLWHGANWTFIAWGMLQFIAIGIEKLVGLKTMNGVVRKSVGLVYTMLFVIIGWVFFNSATIAEGAHFVYAMFTNYDIGDILALTLIRENAVVLVLGIILSTPVYTFFRNKLSTRYQWIEGAMVSSIYVLSFIYVVKGSYSPFIYFNF